MTGTYSLAEAKTYLPELVVRAAEQHARITVTVDGRPAAVMLGVDDLESLEETLAVLSDSAAVQALRDADAELDRGEGMNEHSSPGSKAAPNEFRCCMIHE